MQISLQYASCLLGFLCDVDDQRIKTFMNMNLCVRNFSVSNFSPCLITSPLFGSSWHVPNKHWLQLWKHIKCHIPGYIVSETSFQADMNTSLSIIYFLTQHITKGLSMCLKGFQWLETMIAKDVQRNIWDNTCPLVGKIEAERER